MIKNVQAYKEEDTYIRRRILTHIYTRALTSSRTTNRCR